MNIFRMQRALSPLLRPVSRVYGTLMRLREKRYGSRFSRAYRAKRPVVSIGNIGWGGSGKTPLADWLLSWAEEMGLQAAVLTRGYGGKAPSFPFVVKPESAPGESGDEPLFLARRHPGALVLADPKRARAAAWAERHAAPDFFILDDGMQHMAVMRDINLVLLRPEDLLDEWNRVIPAGSWREPVQALRRADAFLLRADPAKAAALACLAERRLASYGKPLFFFHLVPAGLRRLALEPGTTVCREPDHAVREYLLACAVGAPEQVRESAAALLGPPRKEVFFPDHHAFDAKDARALAAYGLPVVCTGKDAVKLLPLLRHFGDVPVWELESSVCFGGALFTREDFPAWWNAAWRALVLPGNGPVRDGKEQP